MSEVIVIGAGAAGLRASALLAGAGHSVSVLEAADRVGGRIGGRTVGPFRPDHGFQLVNPAYPALREAIDVDALDLTAFPAGVSVRTAKSRVVVADPSREPQLAFRTLRSGLLSPREIPRLTALLGRAPTIDIPLADWLDEHRITGPLRNAVIEPFTSGLVAQDARTASAQYLLWQLRLLASTTPVLPAGGMQALAQALAAAALRVGAQVETGVRTTGVRTTGTGVRIETESEVREAAAVVVAAGLTTDLGLALPPVRTRGMTTWWFAADEPPQKQRLLGIDGRHPRGPVTTLAEVTAPVPEAAPPGRHLLAANVPLGETGPGGEAEYQEPTEGEVRAAAADLSGVDTARWEVVAIDRIAHALPASGVGVLDRREPTLDGPIVVAGDRYRTSSHNGALESGAAAAQSVSYLLGSR
ncbi:FAD-dependent oxidoreductase [Nocardia zapadnayensis]|uniref:FAD-dependent oxidoreductase n=1 Tax=Brevibacterium sp. R8603A2 TaxID=2929779 RepID=UPI001FF9486B|nr:MULTISPECIES: FAD-dependent oxidoreductase [Actinomycetes]MCK1802885.1 FAD-dependent oxidoreductase [Brevibacterium sp. R8603A2]MCX0277793.1 FAD-dependent oxidoreductase [Nocardia zapadnayensis]